MEIYTNIVCVTFEELTSIDGGGAVVKRGTLKSLQSRRKVVTVVRGGKNRQALYDYESLPLIYRQRFEKKYGGHPADIIKETQRPDRIAIDSEARRYYEEEYTYMRAGKVTRLSAKLVDEYTLNASVLNELIAAFNRASAMTKALNNKKRNLWNDIQEACESLRDEYGHTLPNNMARLKDKVKKYQAEGYNALISGKIGNSNTTKITQEAGEYLIALKRSKVPVYNDSQIFEKYNQVAPSEGWKPIKSITSLRDFLYRPDIEQLWYDAVHGELAAHQKYGRKHMTAMPTMRDSLWYGDGTKLNLFYKEFIKNDRGGGKWVHRTTQVYEVMDAYSEVFLGFHISDTENYIAQYNAYRMAVMTAKHRPYELVHDNQGAHNKVDSDGFLTKVARIHRPTAPYSGQSKTIESAFGRFQWQVLHQDWRFTGMNITAKKANSRPDLDFIAANADKLWTRDELIQQYIIARTKWNEMKHPHAEMSRQEMYDTSKNPDTPAITHRDMVDIFWVKSKDPVTMTDSGLVITIDKKKHAYEVFERPGVPDHEWSRNNIGAKFIVKYDPCDMTSVRLYSVDKAGEERFEKVAEPYMVIHRNKQEQVDGDMQFINQEREANLNDRIERVATGRAIAAKYGMDYEQHGLRMPKIKSAPSDMNRQVEKRLNKLKKGVDLPSLSAGKVTKFISNITDDELHPTNMQFTPVSEAACASKL